MYTKGEWKREGNKIKVLGSGTVAICPSPTTSEGVIEFVANAQLIASAPEYHRVCKLYLDDKIGSHLFKEMIADVQAKAEGK